MNLKELEWKLLEWQEIRKLFPSSSWIRQIVDKLRKWTASVPSVGRGRRRRWARNLRDLVRIYREIQNNIYMYSIPLYIINKHPQCMMCLKASLFFHLKSEQALLIWQLKKLCVVLASVNLWLHKLLYFFHLNWELFWKMLLCPTKLVLAASSASPKHFSPAAPEL